LHHKLFSEEDFGEVVFIPSGGEALVLHSDLARFVILIESRINSEPRANIESPDLRLSMREPGGTAYANMNNPTLWPGTRRISSEAQYKESTGEKQAADRTKIGRCPA
jgi:hypothetical protein